MAAKSYALDFGGYWREPNISGLPAVSGVYGVYACTYDACEKTVSLRRLLYIGEAADVRNRVTCHERWQDWRRALYAGEELCFNAAAIGPQADRERAEAAMIHEHKPPLNVEFVHTFPYDATMVSTSGRNALMKALFTVYPTPVLGRGLLTGGLGQRW
jgi:excinuclease UvrABC nuclease subunit